MKYIIELEDTPSFAEDGIAYYKCRQVPWWFVGDSIIGRLTSAQDILSEIDEAYKRGLEDGKVVNDKGCDGCKYRGTIGMPPCIHCCNNFPNAWKKQNDKPIIGEVVERYLNGKRDGVGMFLGEDGDYWSCLFWTGATFGTFAYPSKQFKRPGKV